MGLIQKKKRLHYQNTNLNQSKIIAAALARVSRVKKNPNLKKGCGGNSWRNFRNTMMYT